jgi:hypothetical protein
LFAAVAENLPPRDRFVDLMGNIYDAVAPALLSAAKTEYSNFGQSFAAALSATLQSFDGSSRSALLKRGRVGLAGLMRSSLPNYQRSSIDLSDSLPSIVLGGAQPAEAPSKDKVTTEEHLDMIKDWRWVLGAHKAIRIRENMRFRSPEIALRKIRAAQLALGFAIKYTRRRDGSIRIGCPFDTVHSHVTKSGCAWRAVVDSEGELYEYEWYHNHDAQSVEELGRRLVVRNWTLEALVRKLKRSEFRKFLEKESHMMSVADVHSAVHEIYPGIHLAQSEYARLLDELQTCSWGNDSTQKPSVESCGVENDNTQKSVAESHIVESDAHRQLQAEDKNGTPQRGTARKQAVTARTGSKFTIHSRTETGAAGMISTGPPKHSKVIALSENDSEMSDFEDNAVPEAKEIEKLVDDAMESTKARIHETSEEMEKADESLDEKQTEVRFKNGDIDVDDGKRAEGGVSTSLDEEKVDKEEAAEEETTGGTVSSAKKAPTDSRSEKADNQAALPNSTSQSYKLPSLDAGRTSDSDFEDHIPTPREVLSQVLQQIQDQRPKQSPHISRFPKEFSVAHSPQRKLDENAQKQKELVSSIGAEEQKKKSFAEPPVKAEQIVNEVIVLDDDDEEVSPKHIQEQQNGDKTVSTATVKESTS